MRVNSRRVTIQNVADKAGVALMTVSRVINTPNSVAEKTRKHVESVMADLGYVKNNIASCLASSKELFCFVLIDSALENIEVIKYIDFISGQGMIPCFLCFKNRDELIINIIKAKSFARNDMFVLFDEMNSAMVGRVLADEMVVNLENKKRINA